MPVKIINLYLSGPMYLGKEQATVWRDEVKELVMKYNRENLNHDIFRFKFQDPCDRWYDRGEELSNVGGYVVQMDKMELAKSHVVLVNASNPGWGTPMEQYIAYTTGKMVIAFSSCPNPSIWAVAHSHKMFKTHIDAAHFICNIAKNLAKVV